MPVKTICVISPMLSAAPFFGQTTQAPPPRRIPPAFTIPENVDVRDVDIYSEGTRMSGRIFADKANSLGRLTRGRVHRYNGLQPETEPACGGRRTR